MTSESVFSGCPSSLTEKVTFETSPSSSILVTSPTLTPAIRTGDVGRSVAEFSKVAVTS